MTKPQPDELITQARECLQTGQFEHAQALYRQLLEHDPHQTNILNDLAIALAQAGNYEQAKQYFERGLAIDTNHINLINNYANLLFLQNNNDEAIRWYRKSLALNPFQLDAQCNLAMVLVDDHQLDEALVLLNDLHQKAPHYINAHIQSGIALARMNRTQEAINHFDQAITLSTDETSRAHALYNKGLACLSLGQFETGWALYENRWAAQQSTLAFLPKHYPVWDGQKPINDKNLLIQSEQGIGDTLQMLRYIPLLEKLAARVYIQTFESLYTLIKSSFPNTEIYFFKNSDADMIDFRIPLMSLPLAMRTFDEAAIPHQIPYLQANPNRVTWWKNKRHAEYSLSVGLTWRGNTANRHNRYRSVPLALLEQLFQHKHIQFITLQKDLSEDEITLLSRHDNVYFLDNELTDFAETAAMMENLDIIISTCTSTAHLAGALGKNTLLMLPFNADWRWMQNRQDCPWYPTARLFRQTKPGDWANVINEIGRLLLQSQPSQTPTQIK